MLSRKAFTLVEMVTALAIIAIMAVVLVPQVMGRLRDSESGALVSNLSGLASAAASYHADIGRYPRRLSNLSTAISATQKDLCGVQVPDANDWNGPYSDRSVTTTGLPSGASMILDTIIRSPTSAVYTTAFGNMVFLATGVDSTSWVKADAVLDGDGSISTGTVTWTTNGLDTLKYLVPIRGC